MKVFVIAGEASGDRLGAALMTGLASLTDVTFDGVGGQQMQAQGLTSRFPMEELSVMGLAEILPKYRQLKERVNQMAQAVLDTKPDVLITIDSPDFGLRVANQVKAASDIRTVHYVAPTVWAWRAGRAAKMAHHVDQVLALFPFEPPLMEAAGMRCDFVGHPVVTDKVASDAEAQAFRDNLGISGPLVLALPGSRRGEIARLADTFGAALQQFKAQVPEASIVLPAAPSVEALVREKTAYWPNTHIIPAADADDKAAAFKAADVALAASGTVSLELAANATPMVVAYDMAWLSRVIISRMLLVDTVTLVNLVSETRVVPEFIGNACQPGPIAVALRDVLAKPDSQKDAMAVTMQRLGQGGDAPGLRAARAVLDGLATKPAV